MFLSVRIRARNPKPIAQIARMALAIIAPSTASSCSGGRLNSWTTVTVQAVVHSMTEGSGISRRDRSIRVKHQDRKDAGTSLGRTQSAVLA